MDIVFDFDIFARQRYGGISRYFVNLARAMVELGRMQPTIVAPFFINAHLAASNLSRVWGFEVASDGPLGGLDRRRLANGIVSRAILEAVRPPVIHQTFFAQRWSRVADSCTVMTIHDLIPERFGLRPEFARTKAERAPAADAIICVSETTRRDALAYLDVAPEKLHVVHHGCRLEVDAASSNAVENPVDGPFILHVGRRARYKNFDLLARAFSRSERLSSTFKLVCFGGPEMSASERDRFEALGLGEHELVYLRGSDSLLDRLYRQAQLFVFPSKYEGFGLPALEAMQRGCPVVSSTGGALPEVVGDAGEYFDPTDADDLAAALEKVAFDDDRRAELIEAGRERCRSFTWRKCAEKTTAVYRSLL
jgi:glycosyltransferase involved in cell wall biosynthesis